MHYSLSHRAQALHPNECGTVISEQRSWDISRLRAGGQPCGKRPSRFAAHKPGLHGIGAAAMHAALRFYMFCEPKTSGFRFSFA